MSNSLRRWSRSRIVVLFAAAFMGLGTLTAWAQAPDSVPGMLQQILTAIGRLQNLVNSQIAADQVNVRFTPVVPVAAGTSLVCQAVNVSNTTHQIGAEFFKNNGALGFGPGPFPVQPGHSTRIDVSGFGPGFCKFTVVDGTRADIRAAISAVKGSDPDDADFVVPAE